MQTIRQNTSPRELDLSIVLLDWGVRESFHSLEYLSCQTVPRGRYEIIWIENYQRRPAEIDRLIARYEHLGLASPVDTWIILGQEPGQVYHKHRLYNLGILFAKGRIVNICDSDAIFTARYVESILTTFAAEHDVVLHIEEIRNFNRRLHPFNYPRIDQVLGAGVVNMAGSTPRAFHNTPEGIADDVNVVYERNYGASFSALRSRLVAIGGADEHEDYRGHICGPYEMTMRLINAGVRERWHRTELMYHVYHPGQGGDVDHCGPNDGRGMSTTALEIPRSRRILPLVENEDIRRLRLRQEQEAARAAKATWPPALHAPVLDAGGADHV